MKGLILAGGKGTRLLPVTRVINKHMVPILNIPMIMYPLETLKSFGIKDIMIVSGGEHIGSIADFLGDGSEFDVSLTYRVQKEAGGIAQALGLAKDFVGDQKVAVILGDNIFDNNGLTIPEDSEFALFVKKVNDAFRFGVINEDETAIIEKPKGATDGWAVTGLYVYPSEVFDIIPTLKPSARGELEITDVNNYFLSKIEKRTIKRLETFWSDAGTPESLKEVINWAYDKSIKIK